jgi:anti-sigma factor RsiW
LDVRSGPRFLETTGDARHPTEWVIMRAMTCRELADFLMDYLNDDLPLDVRRSFDGHLTVCPNCVAYVRSYRTTIELGRRAFADVDAEAETEVPGELVQAILAARKSDPSL